jgi:hypothetical protein
MSITDPQPRVQPPRADPESVEQAGWTFDMRLPDRMVLGMRLGYDPRAAADARRQVIDFLTAHGLVRG